MHPVAACNVILPNPEAIAPSQRGQLPLSNNISTAAKDAITLPQLKNSSLISLGQLYDGDCSVMLNKKNLRVTKNNEIVLKGTRNYSDGLWDIHVYSQKKSFIHYARNSSGSIQA